MEAAETAGSTEAAESTEAEFLAETTSEDGSEVIWTPVIEQRRNTVGEVGLM